MRWTGLFAGFAVVLLAAACGQTSGLQPGGPPAGSSPSATSTPTPNLPPPSQLTKPPDSADLPAARIDYSALPAGYPHEVAVSADGKTLYIRAQEGGCGRASAEVLEDNAQHIVVNLVETQSQVRGQMCPMIIRYPLISVPLGEPLGQRTVVLKSLARQN